MSLSCMPGSFPGAVPRHRYVARPARNKPFRPDYFVEAETFILLSRPILSRVPSVGRPEPEEIEAVMCALYELCRSPNCHVPLEAIRRLARLPGDRSSKTLRWLEKRGLIVCKRHGKGRVSCYPSRKLLDEAKERCPKMWEKL